VPVGSCGLPWRPVVILNKSYTYGINMQGIDKERIRVRCPKCGKRLTDVSPIVDDSGQVVGVMDLSGPGIEMAGGSISVRAQSAASRVGQQPGPRSGYSQHQKPDGVLTQNTWAWDCRCGARPRVGNSTLCAALQKATARRERNLTLS
jgi:hypothetical protein